MVDEVLLIFKSVKTQSDGWGWCTVLSSFLERTVFVSSREVSREAGEIEEVKKA